MTIHPELREALADSPRYLAALEAFVSELHLPTFPDRREPGGSFHKQLRHALYYHLRSPWLVPVPDSGGWCGLCAVCGVGLLAIAADNGWWTCVTCDKSGPPEAYEYRVRSESDPAVTFDECVATVENVMAPAEVMLPWFAPVNSI